MTPKDITTDFEKSFCLQNNKNRGIGIECEIPITTANGQAVCLSLIQNMYLWLETKGFSLEKQTSTGFVKAAFICKENTGFSYDKQTVTTDTGFSTLEIVIAPEKSLTLLDAAFSKIIQILIPFFEQNNCLMLGYGIQPVTPPSKALLMPLERYRFFENFSKNQFLEEKQGTDSNLLTITASNQCHIELSKKDAIKATNTLNALSGLFIALHANSAIWQGKTSTLSKANRELFWEYCFTDRENQVGIPPVFNSMADYVNYLLDFKPLLVERDKQLLQIIDKDTYHDFLFNTTTSKAKTACGEIKQIYPNTTDIETLTSFSWFNARLVPKYGTIETRMCCQQPPKQTLTTTALTLGILENLDQAALFVSQYTRQEWTQLRYEVLKNGFKATINKKSILPLLQTLLDIAKHGLKERALDEEVFLTALYERLQKQESPADKSVRILEEHGLEAFLEQFRFKKEDYLTTTI